MPPTLALFIWFILLAALLRFDPAKDSRASLSIWVPLIWMFIIASRLPSQWFGSGMGEQAQALEEGNPLDRTVFFVLIVLAVAILVSRSFKWGEFFARNPILMAFLFFALVSVVWSDFPFVAFKRWFRDLGNYLVILVVLSDTHPLEAVRAFLRRLHYLIIPLSVLLVKYFPQIGKHYSSWTGIPEYVGVATSKNTLGVLCLLSGIFFFWDTVNRWPERKVKQTRRIILVNVALIAMTLWLLKMSDSATSRICLIIGCLVILTAQSKWGKRHPGFLKVMIPACFLVYVILAFGFDINGELAKAVGRDPTLTGRSTIWKAVLSTNTNPIIGTGYESFWLGPRLSQVWAIAGRVNEAHNGYLELYLNLGFVGVFLIGGLLISSYRTICRNLTSLSSLASLTAALWTIVLFYNMTEAAFTPAFMCLTFFLGTLAVPRAANSYGVPAEEFARSTSRKRQGAVA
jgi:exopolysaccharide production protein ExoQ